MKLGKYIASNKFWQSEVFSQAFCFYPPSKLFSKTNNTPFQSRYKELLESERVYVKDLEQCVDYIKYMRETKDTDDPNEISMPEDLKEGKDRMIFGNIEQIFEWHRE